MELEYDVEYTNTILLVDNEKSILNSLKRLLRKEEYKVITASSGKEGLEILRDNNVQVIISDQRMPGMSGTEFFSKVIEEFPDIIRIILSGYTDVDVVIDTINKGSIYKFFHKPWNDQGIILEIRQAFEHYKLVQDNARLSFQNKALQLYHAVLENISFPIIGINTEKAIAIYNSMASKMQLDNDNIDLKIGSKISDSFPENIVNIINNCFENNKSETLEYLNENKGSYNITCTPFTGRFSGKGVVLSFIRP
ncbi:MAG: response regulator [Desulfobacterales bacterium]|nr:response regulator [Desulfobacterales bacterium]